MVKRRDEVIKSQSLFVWILLNIILLVLLIHQSILVRVDTIFQVVLATLDSAVNPCSCGYYAVNAGEDYDLYSQSLFVWILYYFFHLLL